MEATIFHKATEGVKIRKSFCDKDLGYTGQCEGEEGAKLWAGHPLQCYSCNMTKMAYIKCESASNPLLHAIPEKKLPPKNTGQCASRDIPYMPASSLCRGESCGIFF